MGVELSLWYTDFIKCEFAESYDSSIHNLGGYHHTGFCSKCTNLHSYQWYTRFPFSLHPQKHWLSHVFLIIAIFIGVILHLILVLICIFLMISDVPYFSYIYWPFICILVKNVSSGPLSFFTTRLFSCCLSCLSSFCILDISPLLYGGGIVQSLSHIWLFVTPWTAAYQASLSFVCVVCKYVLPSIGWLLTLLIVCFAVQKLFNLMQPICPFF